MNDDSIAKDERFSHIAKDPRFKKLPKHERKIKIDKRFKSMFHDEKFKIKFSVDKRGRPVKLSSKENLKKYYDISSSDDEDENGMASERKKSGEKVKDIASPVASSSSEASDSAHEDRIVDLARGEGAMLSSSDDTSSAEESEDEGFDHGWGELDVDTERRDDISRRLAACNMDWDRIKVVDLLVLFNSFKPSGGMINSVKIFPSEYGKQRMQEEDMKGPKELVESVPDGPSGDNGKEGSQYHMEKLRKYQLSRLRYYYAVIECDCEETANHIYSECDGLEYEASSTRLDLRFIPEDMHFEDEPHSIADSLPDISTYQPSQFVTTALQQAKVNLTWDETNPDRTKAIQKAFDDGDVAEDDLKAYLASSSDDSDDSLPDSAADEDNDCQTDSIAKYQALINDINDKERKKRDGDVEMEVTWEPGLKDTTEKVLKSKAKEGTLTPWEKYLEKKRKKQGEKTKKKQEPADGDQPFSDDEIPSDIDLNDPYFAEEFGGKSSKSSGKKKKKHPDVADPEVEKSKAELELLMMDDDAEKKHFNMKGIIEEETKSKKRKRERKAAKESVDNNDGFQIDVKDPRFNALYTSHHFNIDPSDQQFKKTKGMEAIVSEKQKHHRSDETTTERTSWKDDNLSVLVKSVKNKTAANYKKIKRK